MLERLQYISQGENAETQLSNIISALDAGCKWIQLRYKKKSSTEVLELARAVKPSCTLYGALLIINDFPEAASLAGADGVHLGLTDLPAAEARKILGPGKIIGGTANTIDDIFQRIEERCDYIGLGPYRFTKTKEHLSPILGLEGYQKIFEQLGHAADHLPVYAIGGIGIHDIHALRATGLYGVALSGLITQNKNKPELIKHLNENLNAAIEYSR